jgi:hypothetical protein
MDHEARMSDKHGPDGRGWIAGVLLERGLASGRDTGSTGMRLQ